MTKEEDITYNPELNYCSFFPEEIGGVRFNYGCYLHDRHYRNERKQRLSRKEADKLLRKEVYRAYKNKNKRILGFIISWAMWAAVRLFASKSYKT